jgi:hypothetical protein
MARYYLNCPACEGRLRLKNDSRSEPIYRCDKCSEFWAMVIEDRSLKCVLKRYDEATAIISSALAAQVPTDWTGEPASIDVSDENWQAIVNPALADTMVDLAAEIKKHIEEGDYVFRMDADGRRTHRVVAHGGQLALVELRRR